MVATLTIDGRQVSVPAGQTVLQAAASANLYIPSLCYHPDLPPWRSLPAAEAVYQSGAGGGAIRGEDLPATVRSPAGCRLCLVEIEGEDQPIRSCVREATSGMVVHTGSKPLQAIRRRHLSTILATHPHACLTCHQRQGCSRTQCSNNVPVEERCCELLGHCELQKVAEYIGIPPDLPRYTPAGLPIITGEPLVRRNYNLCIGCTRCVRACQALRGVGAIGVVYQNGQEGRPGRAIIGSIAPSLAESGCRFCTTCVEVCPTGALMDKGLPTGERTAALVPCRSACPADIEVPTYIRLVAQGRRAAALDVIQRRVPFPAVLGYVCFHPCEEVCRRGLLDEPVAICALKRFAANDGLSRQNLPPALSATGRRVAVVGSGPAGLTAAYDLAQLGHGVTVFEALPEPGGMMRFGIPEYRLPGQVLGREVQTILEAGVELRTNSPVGPGTPGPSLQELSRSYDATLLAVGNPLSKRIRLEGAEREGVLWGLEFLRAVRMGELKQGALSGRVVVIGGGNVAIDVALTALRLGAARVDLACLEARHEMPAFAWETAEAQEEGIALHPSWGPKRIQGQGDDGRAGGMDLVRCTAVFDAMGKFNPLFDEGVTTHLEADWIILAIGQTVDRSILEGQDGVRLAPGGIMQVAPQTLETGVPGLFAAGDVVSGPASVIAAIAMGRRAAVAIDRFLGGEGYSERATHDRSLEEQPHPYLGQVTGFASQRRIPMPCLPLSARLQGFTSIELGYDEDAALAEASRCLQCDLRLQLSPAPLPPQRWQEFTPVQLQAVPEREGAYQLFNGEGKVIHIGGTVNLRQGLEPHLQATPQARFFTYEEDPMYSKRESELLQQFLQEHGHMPEGNGELDDLF